MPELHLFFNHLKGISSMQAGLKHSRGYFISCTGYEVLKKKEIIVKSPFRVFPITISSKTNDAVSTKRTISHVSDHLI